jgi:hypothetical protein
MFRVAIGLLVSVFGIASVSAADPTAPIYTQTYTDCVTGAGGLPPTGNPHVTTSGDLRWTIAPGCDSYQNEFYERPTTQTYQVNDTASGEIFGAAEYFENLDIVQAKAGVDSQYMYVLIDLNGVSHFNDEGDAQLEGLKYQYEFLLSTAADGANGFWLAITEGTPIGTTYQLLRNNGQQDTNGDVGGRGEGSGPGCGTDPEPSNGLSCTKEDNAAAALGNGFDLDIIDDGRLNSGPNDGAAVLFSRLMPGDPSIIEFALDYALLGFSQAQIQAIIDGSSGYLDFRAIKGGPKDPQDYLWNDEYTKSEAGSPYRATSGDLSKSEFGTQGLGNIYELDTLRGVGQPPVIPEPAALTLLGSGVAAWAVRRRRKR